MANIRYKIHAGLGLCRGFGLKADQNLHKCNNGHNIEGRQ